MAINAGHFAASFKPVENMSQTASIYCVETINFQRLTAHPDSFDSVQDASQAVSFYAFEGLRYVLTKGHDSETSALLIGLFEPSTFIGQDFDDDKVDWENEGDSFLALENARIYYHSPDAVNSIADFLTTVTAASFLDSFNPEEMNRERIYPSLWTHNTDHDRAFNEPHILREFRDLKQFFTTSNTGTNYCICCIG